MAHKFTASLLALVLMGAFLTPQRAHAGNDEWATAGKILAGVVGLSVLSQMHDDSHSSRHHSYHTRRPPRRSCARPTVVKRETVYVRPAPAPPPAPAPILSSEPVIVPLEDGKRLYQPRIRGAKAYMQVWSEVSCEWITIKEYPSIY